MTVEVEALLTAYPDWRGAMLSRLREIVLSADQRITESVKWRKPSNPLGVLAWSAGGLVCTGEVYRSKVKLTFFSGAALSDPESLFNTMTGGTRRAIDFAEGDTIAAGPLSALIRQAVALQ